MILYEAGRFGDALAEYEAALELLIANRRRPRRGAPAGQHRRGAQLPRPHRRRAGAPAAGRRAGGVAGQTLTQALSAQNLAYVDTLDGDFPESLRALRAGGCPLRPQRLRGPLSRSLRVDHTRALLQANLLDEAAASAEASLVESAATESGLDHAASLLLAAEVRLATGDLAGSVAAAERPSRRVHGARAAGVGGAVARAVLLRAQAASGPDDDLVDDAGAATPASSIALGCRHDALRSRAAAGRGRARPR